MTELPGNLPPPGGVMESSELMNLVTRLERLLADIEHPLPAVVTRKRAAKELSVSTKTLERMVKRGEIAEVVRSGRPGIPASEIRRIATPRAQTRRGGGRKKTATLASAAEMAERGRAALKKLR